MKNASLLNLEAPRRPARESGIVLISALVVLVLMTILAISMFKSFGMQERIAGNTREKQRAFQAAQSALKYGEQWLAQGNGGAGSACSSLLYANATPPTTQVCSNPLTSSQTFAIPWQSAGADIGVQYTPPGMTVTTSGGVNTYAGTPRTYISPLGQDPTGLAQLYQVTAMGYGGNANAVAVVQSVYAITNGVKDAGGL